MDNTQKFALVFVFLIYVPALMVAVTLLLIALKLGFLDETNAMIDFGVFLAICAITIPFVFGKVRKGIASGKKPSQAPKPAKNPKKARFRPERV